jgi:hypothetical protein
LLGKIVLWLSMKRCVNRHFRVQLFKNSPNRSYVAKR